jgi:hypothetical protein
MKPYFFLLLIVCSLKSSYAQPSGQDTLVMSVERIVIYDKPIVESLQFKPDLLKLKTSEGKKFVSKNYVLQDSAIVMLTLSENGISNIDTIPFHNIVKIRGKVYGNAVRKSAGVIFTLSGVPLALMGTLFGPIGIIPGIGLTASGISMMGARSFNTKDKWTLKTIRKQRTTTDPWSL